MGKRRDTHTSGEVKDSEPPIKKPKLLNRKGNKACFWKFCQEQFQAKEDLEQHLLVHLAGKAMPNSKRVECFVCRELVSKEKLDEHLENHGNSGEWSCVHCKKTFNKKYNWLHHLRSQHLNEPQSCQYCDRTFRDRYKLRDHELTHTGGSPRCEICGKSFTTKHSLTEHLNTHSDKKPYKCELCSSSYFHSTHLSRHKRKCHTNENLRCDQCEKVFIGKGNLKQHKKLHKQEPTHKCDLCNKAFHTKSHLNQHIKTHVLKVYTCAYCLETFPSSKLLLRHNEKHKKCLFKCVFCDEGFSLAVSLSRHEVVVHGSQLSKMSAKDTKSAAESLGCDSGESVNETGQTNMSGRQLVISEKRNEMKKEKTQQKRTGMSETGNQSELGQTVKKVTKKDKTAKRQIDSIVRGTGRTQMIIGHATIVRNSIVPVGDSEAKVSLSEEKHCNLETDVKKEDNDSSEEIKLPSPNNSSVHPAEETAVEYIKNVYPEISRVTRSKTCIESPAISCAKWSNAKAAMGAELVSNLIVNPMQKAQNKQRTFDIEWKAEETSSRHGITENVNRSEVQRGKRENHDGKGKKVRSSSQNPAKPQITHNAQSFHDRSSGTMNKKTSKFFEGDESQNFEMNQPVNEERETHVDKSKTTEEKESDSELWECQCASCGRTFLGEGEFKSHVCQFLTCGDCNEKYSTTQGHTCQKVGHRCIKCSGLFTSAKLLRQHKCSDDRFECDGSIEIFSDTEQHKCAKFQKKIKGKLDKSLNDSSKTQIIEPFGHDSSATQISDATITWYPHENLKCERCKATISDKVDQVLHECPVRSPKYQCPRCNLRFPGKESLDVHICLKEVKPSAPARNVDGQHPSVLEVTLYFDETTKTPVYQIIKKEPD